MRIYRWRITTWKTSSIISPQGNANQNYNKISLHLYQKDACEDIEKLDRLYIVGGNVKNIASLENILAISQKAKHVITLWSSNCTPGHLSQRNEKLYWHKNLYMSVHGRLLCNKQKLESAEMSSHRLMVR